jgi:hypothetical protein
LLRNAKRLAIAQNTTLRSIIETALTQFVSNNTTADKPVFKLRKHTFRGQGLQSGIEEGNWSDIRRLIYEEHGG